MEIVMTRCDKSAPLTIKGASYIKVVVAYVTVVGEVWELYAISQEEGISPFLCTQFCPVYRGRLHQQPGPCLSCTLHLSCNLDWAPRYGLCQGLHHFQDAPLPNRHLSLSEAGWVVHRSELHLVPEFCDKVNCDDIGRRPVFKGRIFGFVRASPVCFTGRSVTPLPSAPLSKTLKNGRKESLP